MREMLLMLQCVAASGSPVLIQGERGVGKELVARAVHAQSPRCGKPFVAVDCAAFQDSLLDSELFGHLRGAFSGAHADHLGLIQAAHGGTLFLDEIGNMSFGAQARMLRVLATGEVRRVGSVTANRVSVRVVAATNEDLGELCAKSRFRLDLLDRLNTFQLTVPPLRERPEDILELATMFLAGSARMAATAPPQLDPEAERALLAHSWPGNVRELQSAMEFAVRMSNGGRTVLWRHLPPRLRTVAAYERSQAPASLKAQVAALEREAIAREVSRANGVFKVAAKELGLTPMTLGRKVKRYGLQQLRSPHSGAPKAH